MDFLWIKAIHIVFIIGWFSTLVNMPRLLSHLYATGPRTEASFEQDRLRLMAKGLHKFMLPLMFGTLGFGVWLWMGSGIGQDPRSGWMLAKLGIVVFLLGYSHYCGMVLQEFEEEGASKSKGWFVVFGAIPILLLATAIALTVIKPF